MQTKKLYESLFILHKCNLNIERLRNLLQSFEGTLEKDSDYALLFTYHINLEALSFLEEFRDGFSKVEQQYSDRIREVRKISSPVLKRIHKWKDLEKFRNNIVAHPWRHKGQFVLPEQFYNIPRNWFEVTILVNLMNYLWTLIKIEFEKEYADSLKYIATFETNSKPPSDYSSLNSDHLTMANEVATLCRSFNKNYYLKVFQYILPDDNKK